MESNTLILSMNVRGISSNVKKRTDIFSWVKEKNAGIVCFQETHSSKEDEVRWTDEWGGKGFFSHHSRHSAGVCILFRRGIDYLVHDSVIANNGRYIILDVTINEHRLTLATLYGHNTDEPDFFDDFFHKIMTFSNTSLLLCGDWNVVQDCSIDNFNIRSIRNPLSRDKIDEFKNTYELLDPWRTCYPDSRKYSWRQTNPVRQSRLDYFLVSEDIFSFMKNVNIIPGYRTDHSAIVFAFSATQAKRGKGYWKFNSLLLRDAEYVDIIKQCIRDTLQEYYLSGNIENLFDVMLKCNDQQFFEILKMKIRSVSIQYSINKSKATKVAKLKLEQDIQALESRLNENPDCTIMEALDQKKQELEHIRDEIISGHLLRSRVNWYENGEKCSEYFCKLEKHYSAKKMLTEVIDDKGNNISDQESILKELELFYSNLYTSKTAETRNQSFFEHNLKLSNEQRDMCEGNLRFDECSLALKNMTNGKSPGSDGFTVEFYKFFWKDIGPFLFRSLYYGYEIGQLSVFQYQSVITCIPKENKDRRFIGNWRPISLLNTDLKVASAVLAGRLKTVLPDIISDSQKGFMKGRFIGENTRLLYDLMHYLEQNNKIGLLLLVDFEKAFDSIEWEFLTKALESFNFGDSICKWFEILYSQAQSCVINNGQMSNFFKLSRGCRQGDPLSPYLFIIGVELLAIKLKANQNIKGIDIRGTESLISQYADDTFMMLDGTELSLYETIKCFDTFYKASGLKVNRSKTKAVWVGSKRFSDHILCPDLNLSWTNSNFRVLGLDFSLDLSSMVAINYTKKFKEVSQILKSWEHRKLTLLGKITVVKTLALSKLIHLFTTLPNLQDTKFQELNSILFKFIWCGKPDKIRRTTLVGDLDQGGLNMVHLPSFVSYLKIGWVKRFFDNPAGPWQTILLAHLHEYGGERLFNLESSKLNEIVLELSNPFWRDVISSFANAKPLTKVNMDDILSLDILNFVPCSDFIYYDRWKIFGIRTIYDIIDPTTKQFYSFAKIKDHLYCNNFLRYYSIISKILKSYKDCIKEKICNFNLENVNTENIFLKSLLHSSKPKFIYRVLRDKVLYAPHDKFLKWEDMLGIEIPDWTKYFDMLKKMHCTSYLLAFQFKLLHRILPTNKFLYSIHLKDTKYCSFCRNEEETLEHLFFDCRIVNGFLESITTHFGQIYDNFMLNKSNILLGYTDQPLFLNFLFLVIKNYIYKCKLKEKLPNIIELKSKLWYIHSLEEYIAIKNNKVLAFEEKWNPLSVLFP